MMSKTLSVDEIKKLPVGTIILFKKDDFWAATKYRIIELHGLKCFCGVYTGKLLTIKPRPKNKIYYELDLQ